MKGGGNQNKVLQDWVTWTSADSYWIILIRYIQNEDDISKSKNGLFFFKIVVLFFGYLKTGGTMAHSKDSNSLKLKIGVEFPIAFCIYQKTIT